jgi:hypothetical protein
LRVAQLARIVKAPIKHRSLRLTEFINGDSSSQ